MANIKTLKDLTPGTVFDAGPIDVRVLDHMTNGTTLLIADKAVAWRPFSLEPLKTRPEEAPTPYPNDFSLSYLKDELNGPFLAAFDTAGGPIRSANIVEANWSLADHRGGFGYGNTKAKISLLPEALFLKYKSLLALDLLADFRDAGGVILPVKPNGTVWLIRRRRVVSATVMFVGAGADGLTSFSVLRGRLGTTAWSSEQFTEHDIGKMVFLTKEAAEAALEGGGAWQQ